MRLSAAIAAGFLLVLSAGAQNPQAPGGARGGGGFVAYPQRPIADPEAVARGHESDGTGEKRERTNFHVRRTPKNLPVSASPRPTSSYACPAWRAQA